MVLPAGGWVVCGTEYEDGDPVLLAAVRAQERERADAVHEEAWRDWEHRVVAELASADPIERLVRYVRVRPVESVWWPPHREEGRRAPGIGRALRDLLPDIFSGRTIGGWDDDEVHAWLIRAAKEPASALQVGVTKRRPFGARLTWAAADGWVVGASDERELGYPARSIAALADGRRGWYGREEGSEAGYGCRLIDPPPGFTLPAIWRLGEIAQLPDLPSPPGSDGRYADWRLWGL